METIFEKLKEKYGNHTKAAKALKLDPRTYRRMRHRPSGMSKSLQALALLVLNDKAA